MIALGGGFTHTTEPIIRNDLVQIELVIRNDLVHIKPVIRIDLVLRGIGHSPLVSG